MINVHQEQCLTVFCELASDTVIVQKPVGDDLLYLFL